MGCRLHIKLSNYKKNLARCSNLYINVTVKRIMLCSDSHGDAIDSKTANAFLARKKDFKPDTVIHLGDAWDFKSIRRGASAEEKACSMLDDYTAGCEWLESVYKGKHDNFFCWGNHDWRVHDVADGADGPRSDAAQLIIEKSNYLFRKHNVSTTPFDTRKGVLRLGKMAFIHGYCHSQNAAKKHAETYGGMASHVFAGDLHADIFWQTASLDPVICQHIPCMTGLDPDYARKHINKLKHSQGWAEIHVQGNTIKYQIIKGNGKGKYQAFSQIKEY